MKDKTKHRQIVEYVLDLILAGSYNAGDRLPSDSQLVRKFSTSRPTVAKAMRQLEEEGYVERRVGSGSYVRFNARSKPRLIGLLTPEIGDAELFGPLCNEIAVQCQKKGLSLLWTDTTMHQDDLGDAHEKFANELCNRFIAQDVSGVFFAPVEFTPRMTATNRDIAHRLDEAGISVVLLDRDLERLPNRSQFDWVGIDNFRAGYIQADHLIKAGCRKLAYVSRLSSASTIDLRIAGFQHAAKKAGLQDQSARIVCGDVSDPNFLEELQPAKLDGIVCSNDTTASYLLGTLISGGVRVPDDVRMIGIDDVKIAENARVALTTVHQPFRLIGKVAVDTMISRIENRTMVPRSVFVDIELVVRESCGTNASKKASLGFSRNQLATQPDGSQLNT